MRKPSSKKGFVEKTSERLAWPVFEPLGCEPVAGSGQKKPGARILGPVADSTRFNWPIFSPD
jgi:hypothetical protein